MITQRVLCLQLTCSMCNVGEARHGQNTHLVSCVHCWCALSHTTCRDGSSIQRIVNAASLECYSSCVKSFACFYITQSPGEGLLSVAKGYVCMQCGLQGDFIIALPKAGVISPQNGQTDCSLPDVTPPTAPDWPRTSEGNQLGGFSEL